MKYNSFVYGWKLSTYFKIYNFVVLSQPATENKKQRRWQVKFAVDQIFVGRLVPSSLKPLKFENT